MNHDDNVAPFEKDAAVGGGYVYTKSSQLSSQMATKRTTDLILERDVFSGRKVLDLGCGDGHFTRKWWDLGRPKELIGVDAAKSAVEVANTNKGLRDIQFIVADAHHLPFGANSFDVVLMQSVLHHDDDPGDMIREAFRIAPEILIHEPNGNNVGLKLIERTSKYHIEHKEKSYWWFQFNRWISNVGGQIVFRKYGGFVPMFCPDRYARFSKKVEPYLEVTPIINSLMCAVVVIHAVRKKQ